MNTAAVDAPNPLRVTLSVILLRVLLPLYILAGVLMKLLFARPSELPQWIQSRLLESSLTTDVRPTLLAFIILVELVAVLVMVLLPRFARMVGAVILAAFLFVLISEVTYLANRYPLMQALFDGSCGCFGEAVAIAPGVMLIIDGVLLILLMLTSRRALPTTDIEKSRVVALVTLSLLSAVLAFQAPLLSGRLSQDVLADNVLRPHYWIGKPFSETPLARIVDIDPTMLGGGKQHWVFYRKSCSVCHGLFEDDYSGLELPEGLTAVVAIHVPHPPGAPPPSSEEEIECPTCEFVELDPNVDWLVSTPGTVIIEDGIIVEYIDGQIGTVNWRSGDI